MPVLLVYQLQNEFLESLEIPEGALKHKQKIEKEFYRTTDAIYKRSAGRGMSIEDRRKVIDLEEKLHHDYKQLFGAKKWNQYRKFVDDFNEKLLKNHKSREMSPLMMGY